MNQNNDLNTYLDIIANYNFTPLIDDVKNSPYLIIESLLVIFFMDSPIN